MGSFANTLFSILLGWLQAVTSVIWSALTEKGGESFLQFIGKNWIMIAVILCAAGLAVDFAVYLFRWEPYKVWKTFFRRLKADRSEASEESAPDCGTEENRRPEQEKRYFETSKKQPEEAAVQEDQDDLFRWRGKEIYAEEEEQIPAEITKAGYSVPADSPYRRPEAIDAVTDSPDNPDRSRIKRRRNRLVSLLGDSDDEEDYHYYAPKPMMDQKEAYHAPVYPKKWKESREQDS